MKSLAQGDGRHVLLQAGAPKKELGCQAGEVGPHFQTPPIIYIFAIDNGNLWLIYLVEGSLEVKLPTIWTDEKQSREEAERRERLEERRIEEKE